MTEPANPIRRFIGLALIVLGIFWMAASGLCSLWMIVEGFSKGGNSREMLPIVFLVGGFSVGLGFVFFYVGRWVSRP
jgi:hypothetical protein